MANTTSVSHGVPCWLPALFDLLNGVDVFERVSKQKSIQIVRLFLMLRESDRVHTLCILQKNRLTPYLTSAIKLRVRISEN